MRREGHRDRKKREREKAGEDGNIKKIKEEKKVDFLLKGKALCIL